VFETAKLRIRSFGRLLVGGVGFAVVVYSLLLLYERHETLQNIPRDPRVPYERAFMAGAEVPVAVLAAGVLIVFLASR